MTLTGEPGIGKSHIALALNERLQDESHITLRYFCSEHHTHSALFPFINQLERAAGFKHSDLTSGEAIQARRSTGAIHDTIPNTWQFWPICWRCRPDDHYRLQELTPQKRKEKTFAALLAQLDGLAAQQPVLLIFEDVHWIDPTSLELLAATVEHVPQLRALVLITARPEFTPPWPSYPHTYNNPAHPPWPTRRHSVGPAGDRGQNATQGGNGAHSRHTPMGCPVRRGIDEDGAGRRIVARAGRRICPRGSSTVIWRSQPRCRLR